jgi:hypothetical protein
MNVWAIAVDKNVAGALSDLYEKGHKILAVAPSKFSAEFQVMEYTIFYVPRHLR